ncbi:serine/threonine-protein kinase [Nocardia sp. GCM10030253]|uniref:serine/threonine-protein kinase n=1 Tax=Nocardia sp. GCM10030253 TaxID=3273404 RepID=UPI00362B532A
MGVVEGQIFAGYRIEGRLGIGGMGTVFLVQHPRLPRKDALKILSDAHADEPEFRARFLREAEVAARLQHPNLVAVRDRGEQDGQLWIAMQYVEGTDAAELLRRGSGGLDPERAVRIATEAAKGLDELHRAGLLHRDVKPANILVSEQDGRLDRVLVTDFGIARPADDSPTLAGSGGFSASLAYAAPEQIGGDPMDHRADVYSLGCTLYQMLTGAVPFPRDSPGSILYAHLNEPPPRPTLTNPEVPAGFDAVIATAMAKDPARRYPSCGALAAAAAAALAGTELIDGVPDRGHSPSPRRDRLLAIGAATIAVAAVAVSALIWIGRSGSTTPSPTPAAAPPIRVNAAEWGAYAYVVQAFPELMPASPAASGYQEIASCLPIDERGTPVSFDLPAPKAKLFCIGNRDPAMTVSLVCNADRSPFLPGRYFARQEGNEAWTRTSGTGHVNWGTDTGLDGKPQGRLEVYFDDSSRSFCAVQVIGGGSGSVLRSDWWPDAPL